MVNVVFVAPYSMEATNRFLAAFVELPGVSVGVVSSDVLEKFPASVSNGLDAHWRIGDCLDPDELAHGVGSVGGRLGGIDVLTGILETLQVPIAQVRNMLGIAGMGVEAAVNFRDKAQMKRVFEDAGIPCARSARASSGEDARRIQREWQTPIVVKPLEGMGAKNTFRIQDADQLERWLAHQPPSPDAPVLLEEFLTGREFSFDSVVVGGELVWHSISRYDPTPLTVLETPWIQWSVVLPRSIDGPEFAAIRDTGPAAVRALGLDTGLSHMEWFLRPDGSVAVSEVGARPPGAQISSLMSWAHDMDMYAAWAELMAFRRFDPAPRRHAVGAAYLRAQGAGTTITAVHGLDQVSDHTSSLVVESQLPRPGSPRADTYEGEGYVIVRADDTASVEGALSEIISTIRVECA